MSADPAPGACVAKQSSCRDRAQDATVVNTILQLSKQPRGLSLAVVLSSRSIFWQRAMQEVDLHLALDLQLSLDSRVLLLHQMYRVCGSSRGAIGEQEIKSRSVVSAGRPHHYSDHVGGRVANPVMS